MVPLIALRLAMLGLCVGWCLVLLQPQDIITYYLQYDVFEQIGDHVYWLCWSAGIAAISALGLAPLFPYWRALSAGLQMAWWITVSVLFAMRLPIATGLPGYAFVALICGITARGTLRSGRY